LSYVEEKLINLRNPIMAQLTFDNNRECEESSYKIDNKINSNQFFIIYLRYQQYFRRHRQSSNIFTIFLYINLISFDAWDNLC